MDCLRCRNKLTKVRTQGHKRKYDRQLIELFYQFIYQCLPHYISGNEVVVVLVLQQKLF